MSSQAMSSQHHNVKISDIGKHIISDISLNLSCCKLSLKLINKSLRLSKENHDCDGVSIYDLD